MFAGRNHYNPKINKCTEIVLTKGIMERISILFIVIKNAVQSVPNSLTSLSHSVNCIAKEQGNGMTCL